MQAERLARRIAEVADSKQATDLVVLDMRVLVGYTDFLVICTARNERQAKAIHDQVHEVLKREDQLLPARAEGVREARWILLDYLDAILHVFTPDARDFYRLESLWGEAPRLELALNDAGRKTAAGGA
jgi:ribosome-associated protein